MAKHTKLFLVSTILVLVIAVAVIVLQNNSPLGTYTFNNIDDIDVELKAVEFKKVDIQDKDYIFLYFEYKVNNRKTRAVQFDPSVIRLKVNGVTNSETQYHSIASAIAEPIPLPAGESLYFLYGVYPANINRRGIDSLLLEDAGFSVSAFDDAGVRE